MSKPQLAGRLASAFIESKLTPLILIASIAMGTAAVVLLPEEFDRLQERRRFVAAVSEGLADAEAGRVIDDKDLDISPGRRRR